MLWRVRRGGIADDFPDDITDDFTNTFAGAFTRASTIAFADNVTHRHVGDRAGRAAGDVFARRHSTDRRP